MTHDPMRDLADLAARDRVTIYTDSDAFDLERWERADRAATRLMIGAILLLTIALVLAILGAAR